MPLGRASGFSCKLAPQQPPHAPQAAQHAAQHSTAQQPAAQQPAAMPETASGLTDGDADAGTAAGFSRRLDAARPHGAAATLIAIATPAPITAGSIVLDRSLRLVELMPS